MSPIEFIKKHGQLLVIIFGVFSVLTGVIIAAFWPTLFDYIFFKQIELQPGTKSFGFWTEPPQPLYLDIYLWNWTNPSDFKNTSTKPIFNEIGPFRFQEFPTKTNVKFHNENATVSYRKSSRYSFIAEDSKGQLDDVITSLNVISLAVASRAKDWGFLASRGVSAVLSLNYGSKIHVTKTAAEWLFEGFEDPMINMAASNPLISDIPKYADKFGWFYKKNNTDFMLGDFNVNTGIDDIAKIGLIRQWNHASSTNFFQSECAELSGSGGDFFTPNIKREQILELFSPEMCRSVPMEFEEEISIHGIKTLKFSGGDRAVDNGTLYPENECFCGGTCVPSGLFNVSACRFGTPVFMSFPHFYHADSFYHSQVQGMSPNKNKHQFFMSFEPKTAVPLEVAARFQINLLVEPISSIAMYRDLPRTFMPVLWFEQHVKMSESIASEIKLALNMPFMGQIMGIIAITIGLITLLIVALVKTCSCVENRSRRKIKDVNQNVLMAEKINNGSIPETKILLQKKQLFS